MPHSPLQELQRAQELAITSGNATLLLQIAEDLEVLGSAEALAFAHSSRAHAERLNHNYARSTELFAHASELFNEQGNSLEVAKCMMSVGSVQLDIGEFGAALASLNSALQLYEKANDRHGIAATSLHLGSAHNRVGQSQKGLQYLETSKSLFLELGDDTHEVALLNSMAESLENLGDMNAAMELYRTALNICETQGNHRGKARPNTGIGRLLLSLGDLPAALEHMQRALAILTEVPNNIHRTSVLGNIGVVYYFSGDYPTALEYWSKALEVYESAGNQVGIANMLCNCGNVYGETGDEPKALENYQRALDIHLHIGDLKHATIDLGNIANTHSKMGNLTSALEVAQRAMAICKEIGDANGLALKTVQVASIYTDMGNYQDAEALLAELDSLQLREPRTLFSREHGRARLLDRRGDIDGAVRAMKGALQLASDAGFRQQMAGIHGDLRDYAMKRNDLQGYIEHNNEYTRITEEINGKATAQKLAMMEAEKRIAEERAETEKHRALLYNTLPPSIADRVLRGERVNDAFDIAAVLFMDMVGFTAMSAALDPNDVVRLLSAVFTACDAIIAKHDLMKIKTIGDSYMAVAFPTASTDSKQSIAERAASAAAAMLQLMLEHFPKIQVRIGIHCGAITAGVIGTERLQYDVWGDTVNVASRMESTGEPGRIHVSEAFAVGATPHASLDEFSFRCIERGTVDIKGKGLMKTYWLERA